NRADAARRNDECVRGEHKMVETGEECAMLEGQPDKRIYFLFERQIDAYTQRLLSLAGRPRSFVRRLHKSGTAAGDDVAIHRRQRGGYALGFLIGKCPGF